MRTRPGNFAATFSFLVLFGFFIFCFLFNSAIADISHKSSRSKPLPPLAITIAPVQQGLDPADIRPGDIVQFTVTARALINAEKMIIKIETKGGAELVSGERSWSGPVARDEEKKFSITVKAPVKGTGRIDASVSIPSSDHGPRFSARTQYILGTETRSKPEREHPVRKDSKGRDVIEYR